MTSSKHIIKYTPAEERLGWSEIKDIVSAGYSEADIVEMCQRFLDSQKHSRAYRERAKVKAAHMAEQFRQMESKLKELGEL